MKKELNYASPQACKQLKDLGIQWRASAYWRYLGKLDYVLTEKWNFLNKGHAAYNLTELGHMIPFGFYNEMKIHKYLNGWFKVQMTDGEWKTFTSEAEARAWYLIDLIKSGKVQVTGVIHPDKAVKVGKKLPVPTEE